ncbi:MAG: GSU2403 family nucleotidyltransferase fold protein [Paludibaculum sp.]
MRNPTLHGSKAEAVVHQTWTALGPYQEHAVLVGGLAVFAYAWHPDFAPLRALLPLATVDADLAITNPLELATAGDLSTQLQRAGLVRRDVVRHETAYTCFDFPPTNIALSSAYVEFLSPTDNLQVRDDEPQNGLRVHLSPHAWMLLEMPWTITHKDLVIRVAHPLAFAAQKLLIRESRPLDKRSKDLADVIYVLGGFQRVLPTLFADLPTICRAHPNGHHVREALDSLAYLCSGERPIGPREVASAYGHAPSDLQFTTVTQSVSIIADRICAAWRSAKETGPTD